MKQDIIRPNVKNFIKSLRDMGYNFEIAVADIIDNSITAKANEIHIQTLDSPEIKLSILDDGVGMSENELVEAMRLGSKDPDNIRDNKDLGRFGLGLKTASFSQCKKLTVITKQEKNVFARQWDLDYIVQKDDWYLMELKTEELTNYPQFSELLKSESGTLIIWESLDNIEPNTFTNTIYSLRDHLALVFHRFLEGEFSKVNFTVNNIPVEAFNPFNENNSATQRLSMEKFQPSKEYTFVKVYPYILPHYSKVSRYEYEKFSTSEGYTKTQGFYLYRAGRLLVHGTWWGLAKISEAHKLVRIKIDIPNDQDHLWNIDIKKSIAQPKNQIKKDLKRILATVLDKGSRVYTGRGKSINKSSSVPMWKVTIDNNHIKFSINKEHPLLQLVKERTTELDILNSYVKALEAYLPINAIQSHLVSEPHKINQESLISEDEIAELASKLKEMDLSEDHLKAILETELFKNKKELLKL
ncbi:ATP-binding protein [Lysinibacillus xylanilyticus]|uniref:ATP-binding protein n=1 Tax=Lysinibacillus xylanilyticus TaxID=582475 RepID=UPI00380ABFA0